MSGILESKGKTLTDVVQLKVPDDILEARITGRLLHKPSGRTYHKLFRPPKEDMKDDVTGEALIVRKDDTAEVLRPRLKVFHEQADAILGYYRKHGIVRVVDGNTKLNAVWERIKAAIGGATDPQTS